MSTEEYNKLSDEELLLLKSLEEIRLKKKKIEEDFITAEVEKKKIEDSKKEVTVTAKLLSGSNVIVKSEPYRDDMRLLFSGFYDKGVSYNSYNREFAIPLLLWGEVKNRITETPNTTLKYVTKKLEEDINWMLTAPIWSVELGEGTYRNQFVVKPGPQANSNTVYYINGAVWNADKRQFTIPITEGVALWETLHKIQGTFFTEAARDFIVAMVESRTKLDKIALAEDIDFPGRTTLFIDPEDNVGKTKNRPFQNVGIEFAWQAGGNIINANEMGLGKTREGVGYAWRLHKHIKFNHSRNARIIYICPGSLKSKVNREIKRLTGVSPMTMVGATPSTYDMACLLGDKPIFTIINYDIIRTSSNVTKETIDEQGIKHIEKKERFPWIELINMYNPDLIIIDEAHKIKNTDSKQSQAVRSLVAKRFMPMTGTPVLNRPAELWPMLTLVAPHLFPSKEQFIRTYTYDGKSAKNVEELKKLLRPLMIRRLKKDVEKDLPPINRIEEYHELSPKAAKLYNRVLEGIFEAVEEWSAKGERDTKDVTNILTQIMRLKQVCAIDKVDITAEIAIEAHESMSESINNKVVIFSQFKAVAYAISRRLQGEGVLCFVERTEKGFRTLSQSERDDLVQRFQSDDSIKYMVVTEKTATEGHDMTKAGTIIFNDLFWTPASHEQGEGRAYGRLLDSHSINSYYMIVDSGKDEQYAIEEWIMDLLKRKMRIIEEVVEGVQASRDADGSVAMELIQRIKESLWTRKK